MVPGLKLTIIPEFAASTIVLIFGALSTVGAAFGASFSPQQSWHLNAAIYGRLRNVKARYELDEHSNVFDNQEGAAIATMFNQHEAIRAD